MSIAAQPCWQVTGSKKLSGLHAQRSQPADVGLSPQGLTRKNNVEASVENCIDLPVNAQPSTWAMHFPERGFRVSGADLNLNLHRETPAATPPGPAGPRSPVARPVLVAGAPGCYLQEFLQSTWFATSGPPRAFIFSQAHFCCFFNANLSIHRLKLILGPADLRVSRVVFLSGEEVSE